MDGFALHRVRAFACIIGLLIPGTLPAQNRVTTSSEASAPAPAASVPADLPTGTADPKPMLPQAEASSLTANPPGCCTTCCIPGVDWSKVPPIHVFPRPGYFGIFPGGPGCYSLLDCWRGNCVKDRPKYGYIPFVLQPPPFFDTDFRYLEKTPPQDFLESLHRIHVGDHWLFATGGEFRWRHMNEVSSRLTGLNNEYDLLRTRLFVDAWYEDRFRVFAEFFDARSFHQSLPPLVTDVDHADFYNLFFEFKLLETDQGKAYVRAGRQELLYGSQRLISPPDWNNTRRTFDGIRAYYQTQKWDFDLFWAQPVIPNPSRFDSVDNNQNFAGAWATYRPEKGQFRDFYYLFLDNTNRQTQQGIVRAPFNVHTVGTRWTGDKNQWLYDFEGMMQFGQQGRQDIFAGAASAGLGYHFKDCPMAPVAWLYYDYASGDQNPNAGHATTFNQLFPFGHYYMGWLDLVGRQNIHDLNAHLYVYPTKWVTLNVQFHHFELASGKDALYNAAGAAIRRDPTGRAGHNVGSEIDLIANFHLSKRTDFLVGYSQMWSGNFIERTGSGLDPSSFYAVFNVRW